MLYLFIAVLAGASIVAGRIINSNLAEKIGIFQGTFLTMLLDYYFHLYSYF
ncbi:hypothetical protein CFSAN002368_13078 [Clostridium botulinum A1 str. CFSAN002368]|nr:hypothetical protein CFSAN002368_13078 [Clostridium botulinum A1 str. CFSAN002368]